MGYSFVLVMSCCHVTVTIYRAIPKIKGSIIVVLVKQSGGIMQKMVQREQISGAFVVKFSSLI